MLSFFIELKNNKLEKWNLLLKLSYTIPNSLPRQVAEKMK